MFFQGILERSYKLSTLFFNTINYPNYTEISSSLHTKLKSRYLVPLKSWFSHKTVTMRWKMSLETNN